MTDSAVKRLFISYSRDDIDAARALKSHLNPLLFSGRLEVFFDTESIEKGEEWEKKIDSQLQQADAFIFLISRHYFDSEYVLTKELPGMIRRFREQQVKCWPFYLSEYAWDDYEFEGVRLSDIQAIGPFDDKQRLVPLNELNPSDQDKQFKRVYGEVKGWIIQQEEIQQAIAEKAGHERDNAAREKEEQRRLAAQEAKQKAEQEQAERERLKTAEQLKQQHLQEELDARRKAEQQKLNQEKATRELEQQQRRAAVEKARRVEEHQQKRQAESEAAQKAQQEQAGNQQDNASEDSKGNTVRERDSWDKLEILMRPMGLFMLALSLAVAGYFVQRGMETSDQQQTSQTNGGQLQELLEQQRQREQEIHALLGEAQRLFDSNSQRDPAVIEILQQVQRLDSGNPRASDMLDHILARYIQLAEEAIAREDFDAVAGYLEQAQRLSPDSRRVHEALDRLNGMLNDEARAEIEAKQAARDAARGQKPGQVFQDRLSSGGEGPPMVVIPSGTFVMGSPESEAGRKNREGPQHEVSIRSFALGRTEVTFNEYDRFADATGRKRPNDQGWGRGSRPVINVSWNDATAYAEWLSEQTGKRYRLPSEAEWEYAARAGSTSRFHFGDDEAELCNYANFADKNYDQNSTRCDDGVYRQTAAVGRYQPNRFGLLDMHGNVWEWTQDCWHGNYEGAPGDGSVWLEADNGECARRVVRGGDWSNAPKGLRSADRGGVFTNGAKDYRGFRLARDL